MIYDSLLKVQFNFGKKDMNNSLLYYACTPEKGSGESKIQERHIGQRGEGG